MNPHTWQRVKQLFSEAADLPAGDRAAFVRRETADRPELANEVLKLLALDPDADDPIERLTLSGDLLQAAASRHRHYPGELLASRYEIRRFLAAGGSGEVYEAEDLERGERIAVKSLSREIPGGDQLAWLRREVGAARRVNHRNVAKVYDLVQSGSTVFLTMELLAGETLAARLKREGAMSCREALPLVRQMVAGLAAAHAAGVVHRDLKPGNVMIVPRPDGPPRAVITDFGLARPAPEDPHTTVRASSQVMGTPAYMAPEQVLGRSVTPAADVYALGVVLYEMLTGATPFAETAALTMAVRKTTTRPESPAALAPGIRKSWALAVMRCLEPDPKRRFREVGDLLAALEARSVNAQRWSLLRRRSARFASRVTPARFGWAMAALAMVAAITFGWFWRREAPTPNGWQAWERGISSLWAGEPVLAARLLEAAAAVDRLPDRAALDLALAWHRAGFTSRTRAALPSGWRVSGDRAYEAAVRAAVGGQPSLALIRQRAEARPHDASAQADLAAWEPEAGLKPWQQVLVLRPNHLAAHVRLADLLAKERRWPEAERSYLAAQTLATASGNRDLARVVAGRRGMARLQLGDPAESVRADLLPFIGTGLFRAGAAPCERKLVLQEGTADGFAMPPDAAPALSPRLSRMISQSGLEYRQFDERRDNRPFGVSFPLPPVRICAAQLVVRVRQNASSPAAVNDGLAYGAAPFDAVKEVQPLWARMPQTEDQVFVVDIGQEIFARIQLAAAKEPTAWFDLVLNDDTDIDYAKLTLVY